MNNLKKVFAIFLVAMVMVTICACATQASEPVSKETVMKVQEALNNEGFECGTPDGIAGNNTKNAISEYQKSKGMAVTGEIDDELLNSLFPPEESQTVPAETAAESTAAVETAEESTTAAETQGTENTTEVATPVGAGGTEANEEGFQMDPGDAMFFQCADQKTVKLRIEEGDVVCELVDENREPVKELYRFGKSTGTNDTDFVNYIAEKYFISARDVEDGLEQRVVEKDYQELRNPNLMKNENQYHCWTTYQGRLEYVFADGKLFYMLSDPEAKELRVAHSKKEGGAGLLLSFVDEISYEETEVFVNDTFIISRVVDDPVFSLYLK